jgi:hypothetical protein
VTHDLSTVSIYGPTAPSTRVRAYEWLDHLALDATRDEYAGLGDHSPRTALTHLLAIARAEGRVRSLSRSSSWVARSSCPARRARGAPVASSHGSCAERPKASTTSTPRTDWAGGVSWASVRRWRWLPRRPTS